MQGSTVSTVPSVGLFMLLVAACAGVCLGDGDHRTAVERPDVDSIDIERLLTDVDYRGVVAPILEQHARWYASVGGWEPSHFYGFHFAEDPISGRQVSLNISAGPAYLPFGRCVAWVRVPAGFDLVSGETFGTVDVKSVGGERMRAEAATLEEYRQAIVELKRESTIRLFLEVTGEEGTHVFKVYAVGQDIDGRIHVGLEDYWVRVEQDTARISPDEHFRAYPGFTGGAEPTDKGMRDPLGFVPRWSTGDWWVVGFSQRIKTFHDPPRDSTELSIPTGRYMYTVVGEAFQDSYDCYVVEVGRLQGQQRPECVDTLHFEKRTLRPVGLKAGRGSAKLEGPYIFIHMCRPSEPGVPDLPLVESSVQARSPGDSASVSDSLEDSVWRFKGIRSKDTGSGIRAAQLVQMKSSLIPSAVVSEDIMEFASPTGPYYEVMIAYGPIGEALSTQIWHEGLPWFLFCEDSYFAIRPASGQDSEASIVPPSPKHTDVERENLSKATPYLRAWLLDYGHGPVE